MSDLRPSDFSSFSQFLKKFAKLLMKEFLVFRSLLRLVPEFEAQLMASLEEEVVSITDLVRPILLFVCIALHTFIGSERCNWC